MVLLCKVVLRTEEETDRFVPPDIEFMIAHRLPSGMVHITDPLRIGAHGMPLNKG